MQKLQIPEFCHILSFIKDSIFDYRYNISFCGENEFLQIIGDVVIYCYWGQTLAYTVA